MDTPKAKARIVMISRLQSETSHGVVSLRKVANLEKVTEEAKAKVGAKTLVEISEVCHQVFREAIERQQMASRSVSRTTCKDAQRQRQAAHVTRGCTFVQVVNLRSTHL